MTIKQKKALENVVLNGGNMYKAMIDAGYSQAMAKNSHKLKQSKSCKEYLRQETPEVLINFLHTTLLHGTRKQKLIISKLILS